MASPRKPKEVQKLTGCVAALNRFISKSTDKCIPFFDTLRESKPFLWTEECEQAFQQLKEHIGKPPVLSKPVTGEVLSLYLAVSEHAVSSVLICREKKVQLPVYYTSKRLLDAETRYPQMEELALALVVTARKLRHYFQAHSIQVLTNHPLRQVLQKPDASGRLLKWSIELSQFDIDYKPRTAIKGQALADFVAEFTGLPAEVEGADEPPRWKLYVDGSSNDNGSGAGLVLHTPEGYKVTSAVRFEFSASNNEAEYEALLAGLRLAEHLKVEKLDIFSDSQLIVNQVPRAENSNADALAKLATSRDALLLNLVPVEVLKTPTTEKWSEVTPVDFQPSWMDPIIRYSVDGELPEDRQYAKKMKYQAARYKMHDNLLYRRGYSTPLLRCLGAEEANRGYYWPSLKKDAAEYAKRCESCERYAPTPRLHSADLTSILSPWPFAKWGIDLIGPLHKTPGGYKFAIVAVDYFTKWVKAEPLTTISEAKCTNFIWNNIVCRFGVPHSLVSDNGKQFNNDNTSQFCELLGIHKNFSSVVYPQSNGQVEAVNKIIKITLKRRLDAYKGKWADELPKVLWAYRTTSRTTTGETPFSMAYGFEAVLPVEVSIPTNRVTRYEEDRNAELMNLELDLLEEWRTDAQLRLAAYQARTARYYNKKVKPKHFGVGDLVLRVVTPNTKPKNFGALGPTWEGPYRIKEVVANGSYRLAELDGQSIKHTWNAD
ncbi:uncharacterized protein LOC112093654 [Morus notabilis]|uniref:uncharacterized protein LOC112093654 n=1 Tax=Morus notabilis TaxID=981085 RepID=UPI000CED0D29|nr:uncharacterized protein LOC112093654 [Morus notabilis]